MNNAFKTKEGEELIDVLQKQKANLLDFLLGEDVGGGDLLDFDAPLDEDEEEESVALHPAHAYCPYDAAGSHNGATTFLPATDSTRGRCQSSERIAVTPRSASVARALPRPRTPDTAALPTKEDEKLVRPQQEIQGHFKESSFDRGVNIDGLKRANATVEIRGSAASSKLLAPTLNVLAYGVFRTHQELENCKTAFPPCHWHLTRPTTARTGSRWYPAPFQQSSTSRPIYPSSTATITPIVHLTPLPARSREPERQRSVAAGRPVLLRQLSLPIPFHRPPTAGIPPIVHRASLPSGSHDPTRQRSIAAARKKHLARVREADHAAKKARRAARARSQVVHQARTTRERKGAMIETDHP